MNPSPLPRHLLGNLALAGQLHEPIAIDDRPTGTLLGWLRAMLRIRGVEDRIGKLVESGEVRCPCHLAIGQEACAVGVASALRPSDRAFGAHRSHGHYIAMGGDITALFAEVLGKDGGCSRGMGGSMHLTAPEVGLLGTVPIVGATIPMAVGAAIAAQLEGSDRIGVTYFGDGATEEGGFHESMNLAASRKAPVLFVCEHNLFSSHLHISLRQPAEGIARFADAHRMPSATIDGNDVQAVAHTAEEMVAAIRSGEGPGFLELVTYRWRGHVGPREDLDVGVRRTEDLLIWKKRDPVARLEAGLVGAGRVQPAELSELHAAVEVELSDALATARSLAPTPIDLADHILFRERCA